MKKSAAIMTVLSILSFVTTAQAIPKGEKYASIVVEIQSDRGDAIAGAHVTLTSRRVRQGFGYTAGRFTKTTDDRGSVSFEDTDFTGSTSNGRPTISQHHDVECSIEVKARNFRSAERRFIVTYDNPVYRDVISLEGFQTPPPTTEGVVLEVRVRDRYTGKGVAGVQVTVEDAWGYFTYVHGESKYTNHDGTVHFTDFDGFATNREGHSYSRAPHVENWGHGRHLNLRITVSGYEKRFEIYGDGHYTIDF